MGLGTLQAGTAVSGPGKTSAVTAASSRIRMFSATSMCHDEATPTPQQFFGEHSLALPIRMRHLLRQVMETAAATLAMSTTGWTKARGGASSRARVTMNRLESVNDGVDGAVTISGEPQGCDFRSILTGPPTLLFFVACTTCE